MTVINRSTAHAAALPMASNTFRPVPNAAYGPYARGAAPLELAEALVACWRLHARLRAFARALAPGAQRSADEAAAEVFGNAVRQLDR